MPAAKLQTVVVAGAYALLLAELFLTARAEEPNTWSGVITDSVVLLVLGACSVSLVSWATGGGDARRRRGAIAAAVLSVLTFAAFWTALPLVFGAATVIISRSSANRFIAMEIVGGLAAVLIAGFMLFEIAANFAPGLPPR